MLGGRDVYRCIKQVDIAPVLAVLDGLRFIGVGHMPGNYRCDVVLMAHFTPEIHDLVAGLGLEGTLARAVLRRLGPRQSIPPHVDDWMGPQAHPWRRFQVPLTSHPDIKMRWPDDGVEVHLAPGFLYEVRFDRMHEVVNNTDCGRVHLQVDQLDTTVNL